jgi:phosphoserine aminotransferase
MPIVCDMSSDIFSRVLDFQNLILSTPKKYGPAGTTIVKEEILGKSGRTIPSILDYEKHIKAEEYVQHSTFFLYMPPFNTMVKEN